jgi:hypothetical protein
MKIKAAKTNFVNKEKLHAELLDYHNKLKLSIENGTKEPIPSDEIGRAIILICNNLAKRYNFYGYTYRDEMVEEGIVQCVAAIKKFDPYNFFNPFAYFSMVAWRSFLRVISKEKVQTKVKKDMMKNQEEFFTVDEKDDYNDYSSINSEDALWLMDQ